MLRVLLSSTSLPQEPSGLPSGLKRYYILLNISNSSLHGTSQNRIFSLATVSRTLFLTRAVISEQPLKNTAAVLLLIMNRQHSGVVLAHNNQLLWFISYHTIQYGQEECSTTIFHRICSEGGRYGPAVRPEPQNSTNFQEIQLAKHTQSMK